MRQSQLFTKTRREAPKDEVSKNAQLLIRAGYIHKEMAGVYSYLPLGLRVLENIVGIIREEMNAIGGQEVFLTALQDQALWQKTGRWSDEVVDNWFKTELKNGTELGLGFTHEEPLTALMTEYVSSYRDLPRAVYQFQTKFRNEARAKSGIMRGREFLMKDLYSFSRDAAEHEQFYELAKKAYTRIFERIGLGDKTYLTYASGGSFSKYSHEFQTLTPAGEDTIYICEKCHIAINEEIIADLKHACPQCGATELKKETAVEVGNIFSLGTRFSDALDLHYLDEKGEKKPVVMGSYGIGPGRLMGTIVETLADEKGIVWPKAVAPFDIHLVSIAGKGTDVTKAADELYKKLTVVGGKKVLYDDRDLRAGEKFADSELIGIPTRVVISEKTLEKNQLEVTDRITGDKQFVAEESLV
jgi:prolyl-tRNA synthetase